ncbi:tellurite resistance TerB family protein [Arsukibacterium sp.]|uniref:tellurite resistance TerB family protein n=1 Tax=Arsukibacterium sp. TaxID=1977258 RepID=UPI002FD94F18
MFNLFKNLLEKANADWQGGGQQHPWQQAGVSEQQYLSVVLMLQLAHADFSSEQQEHDLVLHYLQQEYALTAEAAEPVFNAALAQALDATCLHAFTSKLKALAYADRLALLDQLWKVAYADGELDPNEEAMLRKIADLLFIRHSDYIQSKLAIQSV